MAFTEPYVKAGEEKTLTQEERVSKHRQAIAQIKQIPGITEDRLRKILNVKKPDLEIILEELIEWGEIRGEDNPRLGPGTRYFHKSHKPVKPKNYGPQYGQLRTYIDPKIAGSWRKSALPTNAQWEAMQTRVRAERMRAIARGNG